MPKDPVPLNRTVSAVNVEHGFIVHCPCHISNSPYVVCVLCEEASSQRRGKYYYNAFKVWHVNHYASIEHLHNLGAASRSDGPCNPSNDDELDFDSNFGTDDTSIENNVGSISEYDHLAVSILSIVSLDGCEFFNPRMRRFYELEHHQPRLGFSHIIRNAFNVVADPNDISKEEISFHLKICRLCVDATRSQVEGIGSLLSQALIYYAGLHNSRVLPDAIEPSDFIRSLQDLAASKLVPILSPEQQLLVMECFNKSSSKPDRFGIPGKRGIFFATYPPKNSSDLFRLYLTSDKSVYRNIPCPDVHLTPDKCHAYLHLGPIVASFLAGGVDSLLVPSATELLPSGLKDFTSYYTSPVAKAVYADVEKIAVMRGLHGKVFSLHIKDWANDAQKNSSRTNLLAYNIRTITFLCHGGNKDIRYYNYVLLVGIKGSDHEEVERILTADLLELGSIPHLYYSGYHRGTFWATVNLVAGVRDRPARGETFFIGIHSHIFANRHRYSLYHDENTKVMPCKTCHLRRLKRLCENRLEEYLLPSSCVACADLDYSKFDVLSISILYIQNKTKVKVFSYPTTLVSGSPLPPVERPVGPDVLSLPPVKLDYAFLYKSSLVAFFNFHSRTYESWRRSGLTTKQKRALGPVCGWNNMELESYLRAAGLNKALIQRLKSFSHANILQRPETLLETLRIDILPSAWQRTGFDLSHQHDAVIHLVFHGILPDLWEFILKSLGPLELKSKLEPIVKASLTNIHNLQIADVMVLPFGDGFSMAGWVGTNKLGFSWLIPYYVSHLREVYFSFTEHHSDYDAGALKLFGHAERASWSFLCITSRLLQRNVYSLLPLEVDHYVKLFLYEITSLQETYMDPNQRKKMAYLSTGNFLSMLNLEENLRMFGPIRNFWDAIDEKVVQRVKQAFTNVNMTSERWLAALMENITRDQHLKMLWDRKNIVDSGNVFSSMFRIMKERDLCDLVEESRAFTSIYKDSRFCIVYRKGGARSDDLWLAGVDVQEAHTTIRGSVVYVPYAMSDDVHTPFRWEDLTEENCLFAFFLPFIGVVDIDLHSEEDPDAIASATIIDVSQHRVFDGSKFTLPLVSVNGLSDQDPEIQIGAMDNAVDRERLPFVTNEDGYIDESGL